jgi:hypothetical protein
MRRATVVGATIFTGVLIGTTLGHAQTTVGVDLDLFSSYVWRGLSLTNKPVVEPAVYVTFPAGNAEVTVGGWANIELGKYDDLADDISESGGSSAFDLSEFNPYAEVSFPVGKATLTGGVIGYIYPNDDAAPNDFALLTSDNNTVEIYGKVGLDAPLSPEISIYYDADKIKGAYIEGSVSHSLPASEKVSIDLGAVVGLSVGQECDGNIRLDTCANNYNFEDNGLTHIDLSAAVPFSTGDLSITPVLHLVINNDEATKVTSPSDLDKDVKLWGGVSLSWSRALGEVAEEE